MFLPPATAKPDAERAPTMMIIGKAAGNHCKDDMAAAERGVGMMNAQKAPEKITRRRRIFESNATYVVLLQNVHFQSGQAPLPRTSPLALHGALTAMSRRAESPDDDDADADGGGGGVAFFNNGAAAASDTLLDEADEIGWEDKLVRYWRATPKSSPL